MIIKGRRRRKKKRDTKNATEEIEGLFAKLLENIVFIMVLARLLENTLCFA